MNKLLKSIIAGLLALTLIITVGYAAVNNFTKETFIGEQAAKTIALNHAEKTEADVTFVKVELDKEKKGSKYDVEFYAGNLEFDYEIDAVTGKILSYDYDIEGRKHNQPVAPVQPTNPTQPTQPTQPVQPKQPAQTEIITEAKAKEIALAHAGVKEADATFLKVELDRDDKRVEYEVEFYVGNKEYDYDIDAVTGEIIEFDYDIEGHKPTQPTQPVAPTQPTTPTQPTQTTYITVERAKEIALAHAGVAANQVKFEEADFDYDDGIAIYELEFKVGKVEYEYEINAITGEVIECEIDD